MVLMSRMPLRLMCSVRGMGVALRVSTSTWVRSCLSFSFWATPKRCSSSMISMPRSLKSRSSLRMRCVPTTRSMEPSVRPRMMASCWAGVRKRREHLHAHGELGQAFAHGAIVLLGQDGGGDEQGHLFAIHNRLEGGAHRDLGFAIAHIAHNQPIHRAFGFHVLAHGVNGVQLVVGLFIGEAGGQFILPRAIGAVGMAACHFTFGIEMEQVFGNVGNRFAGAVFSPSANRVFDPLDYLLDKPEREAGASGSKGVRRWCRARC